MPIRLIASDIDGTMAHQGKIVEANAVAVKEAAVAGVPTVLLTARGFAGASLFARELGLTTPVVCASGAVARGLDAPEDLWHLRLPLEAARLIAEFADSNNHELSILIDEVVHGRQDYGASMYIDGHGQKVIEAYLPALTDAPTNIWALNKDASEAILQKFSMELTGQVTFYSEYGGGELRALQVLHPEASKGDALRRVCEHLGVSLAETMAIGDNDSDVSMFQVAGLSVCVGGGSSLAQKHATHVGPPPEEGAVAWAIREFVLP